MGWAIPHWFFPRLLGLGFAHEAGALQNGQAGIFRESCVGKSQTALKK
jgi:hypothetical protein